MYAYLIPRTRYIIRLHLLSATDKAIAKASSIIKHGGVVAHATETCYGLACDLTNEAAVKKLFAIKDRPEYLPVSALFPSIEEAKQWVVWNASVEELAERNLPGPLTIVLPVQPDVQIFVQLNVQTEPTAGVRVSSHPVAQKLSELSGIPLSTTSANLHSQSNPYSVQEIMEQFSGREHKPDLILDSGRLEQYESSTVVAVENGTVKVVRQGAVRI
jgi:L-threonylcarbamoyladenylate synthase